MESGIRPLLIGLGRFRYQSYGHISLKICSTPAVQTASFERYEMVRDGLIAPDSPRGVWEITEKGRKILEKYGFETANQNMLFSKS